jgi:hypothetical protein
MTTPTVGKLGSAALAANTQNLLYTVPVSGVVVSTVNISIANSSIATSFSIAITTSGTPTAADYIALSMPIAQYDVYLRKCVVMSPGEKIIVSTTSSNLVCRVDGFEE